MDENMVVTEETLENAMGVPFEDTPVVETTEELELTAPENVEVPNVTDDGGSSPSWKDCAEAGAKIGVICGTSVVVTYGIAQLAVKVGEKIGNAINKRFEKKAAKEAEKAKQQEELERIAQMSPEEVKAEMDAKADTQKK